ncbi:hypothetical protein NMG29_20195 [Streptomyces cocklensis]|uniref:Uncharacterized protein n=1 Tax=Actinacidiphila cocklensis TaxID=887465 RepID=A0A9W4DWQ3_9ACTN|nr:hypothetical protein [Actinacidiphila cocklensis]MDD1060497.1 hypothetical protein [Actinacidiphila cocklensis]WSX73969.1 hypothetical protein OH826_08900 [Streptomyces sp. NBC_00899]WSX79966.1 hypothetical protein OH826_42610 [Streptomyces sp. NBC_00899]CAG6395312.1 conserved hypothetical protein [Actinacidiphila cocklensis]
MTRTVYADALGRLAREQHQVVTTGQLAVIGVPANAVRNLCRPGGRWQRVLPRVIVLGTGGLTAEQRCRAALAYAGHPQAGPGEPRHPAGGALLTGAAALALHGLSAAPFTNAAGSAVVDVLVPRDRGVRTHTWVRVHTVPALPRAQSAEGLPVVPVARAAVDAVRASCDPLWVRSVLTEVVAERGVGLEVLAEELRAEGLAGKAGVAETLRELRAGSRGPVPDQLRALVRGCGVRTPLWRPVLRLDGAFLGSPDAYWPRDGVALAAAGAGRPPAGGRHERLARLGLRVIGVPQDALTRRPGQVAAALRTALDTGPHGLWDRIAVFPGGG